MNKRISMAFAVVAVVALAVPALANAHALTENGELGAVGGKMLSTSTNTTIQTAIGLFKCEKVAWEGELTKNNGTEVEGKGVGEGTAAGCTVGGKAAVMNDITVTSIVMIGGVTTMNFTAKGVVSGVNCHWASAAAPFTYVSGTDVYTVTNVNLVGTPAATCEPGVLNGNFTLTTPNGTPTILD